MAAARKKAPSKLVLGRTAPAAPGTSGLRRLYLGALGVVTALAFASLWWQINGLIGPQGILPLHKGLAYAAAQPANAGLAGWLRLPTVLWLLPASWGPGALCLLGLIAGFAVAAGRYVGPALLVAYACYLSLCTVTGPFLNFQWDSLLCEVLIASLLVAPWGRTARYNAPMAGWWWLRWITFRLVFFGGLVKLTSGDATWRNLSALDFHFWTQPLPNALGLAAAALPWWVHAPLTLLTLVGELILSWGVFAGRTGRRVAFGTIVVLMAGIGLTGSYGFFQLLTVVLALSLLDDVDLGRVRVRIPSLPAAALSVLQQRIAWAVAAVPIAVSVALLPGWYTPGLVGPLLGVEPIAEHLAPFRVVNRYGLFAHMTTTRPLPVLEARWGDGAWVELTWRWQTSDPLAPPRQVAPHMPRVDWQLWFAGLGTCERNPWITALLDGVLRGDKPVDGLIGDLRLLTGVPPDAVRLILYEYKPVSDTSGTSWTRAAVGLYCPERTAANIVDARSGAR